MIYIRRSIIEHDLAHRYWRMLGIPDTHKNYFKLRNRTNLSEDIVVYKLRNMTFHVVEITPLHNIVKSIKV